MWHLRHIAAQTLPIDKMGMFIEKYEQHICTNSKRQAVSFLVPTQLDALDNAAVVLAPILLKQLCGLDIRRRVGIRVRQQRLNRRENCGYVIDRRPLVLQNVETDAAIAVHVRVEALGDELYLGGTEWMA